MTEPMQVRRGLLRWGGALLAAGALGLRVQAETRFPERTVKIIVPYPAGGGSDVAARAVGIELAKLWGQPVVIENKVGAGGMIGNELVANAPADGYTLLLGITSMVQWPFLYDKLPYDAKTAFAPVSQLGAASNLLVVPSATAANTLKEFVEMARSQPGKLSYGSFGNGSTSHIQGEILKRQASLDLVHVPYNGSTPLINAILGGQVNAAFIDVGTAKPLLQTGRFKALAVTGERRVKTLPNVSTLKELGFPGFEPYGWWGLFAPAATPKDIVAKLSADVVRVMQMPGVMAQFESRDLFAIGSTADAFGKTLAADSEVWGKAIRSAGIKLN